MFSRTPNPHSENYRIKEDNSKNCNNFDTQINLKFVLLGASGTGKTSIYKQMGMNHSVYFDQQTLNAERDRLKASFVNHLKVLIALMKLESIDSNYFTALEDELLFGTFSNEVISSLKKLWSSNEAQTVWKMELRYNTGMRTLEYLFENIDRILSPTYEEPTREDFLKAYVRTTGIVEHRFKSQGITFDFIDMGGIRSERKKWIRRFDNISTIFFTVSLTEFDEFLHEDRRVNRHQESLVLFGKTTEIRYLQEAVVILLLTKVDLLKDKLKDLEEDNVNLDSFFPELKLGTDYTEAFDQIIECTINRFKSKAGDRKIEVEVVNATDTQDFLGKWNESLFLKAIPTL